MSESGQVKSWDMFLKPLKSWVELRIYEERLTVFPEIFEKFPRNTLFWSLLPLEVYLEYNFNPLQTTRRLLYLKTHSLPRSKHFSSRL